MVTALLFNLFGYLVISPAMLAIHRNKVFSTLEKSPEGEIIHIALPKGSDKLIVKGSKKEIRHEGHMYDILSSRIAGEMVVYKCIPDHKEERIIKKAKKMEKDQQNNTPASRNARIFFDQLLKVAFIHVSIEFPLTSKSLSLNTFYSYNYHEPVLQVPALPPQFC
jgi:hypothetical protein